MGLGQVHRTLGGTPFYMVLLSALVSGACEKAQYWHGTHFSVCAGQSNSRIASPSLALLRCEPPVPPLCAGECGARQPPLRRSI